jgi:hypothetical protein
MNRPLGAVTAFLVSTAVCFPVSAVAQSQSLPSIRRVQVLRSGGQLEIEIEASDRIVPQTHAITNPDRLVVDFVNALPGTNLRNQAIHRGEVKGIRVGMFSSDPPVTRVVLDLNGPQPYQVFPSGRTVIVKIGENTGAQTADYHPGSGPVLVNSNYPVQAVQVSTPAPAPRPPLEVFFQNGLLTINSNKASLSEVLFAVHQRTGAEIAIPAGAEQERVMAELGPAPAPEVLAHLLNGSKFNFMILSSPKNPKALDQVILSPRAEGPLSAPRPQALPANEDDNEAAAQSKPPVPPAPGADDNPNAPAEGQAPPPPGQSRNEVPD